MELRVKDQLDWLDMQFGRKPFAWEENLIYYTFDGWKEITGEELNPDQFPERDLNDILLMPSGKKISNTAEWELKADHVREQIKRVIGDLPAYDKIEKITLENERTFRQDFIKAEISILLSIALCLFIDVYKRSLSSESFEISLI